MAATVQAASNPKNSTFIGPGCRPTPRACVSSKKIARKSFHFSSSTPGVTALMITSCAMSPGETASTLPSTMVWMFTLVGDTDTMNSPSPKKVLKISPMITSGLSRVRRFRKLMAPAASSPAKKAPAENGSPSM